MNIPGLIPGIGGGGSRALLTRYNVVLHVPKKEKIW